VNVLGEWYTYLVLTQSIEPAAALPPDTARSAAAGWGGDLYAAYLFEDTQQILLAHRFAWDTAADAEEFWDAFNDYGRGRWGSPDSSSSDRLVWEETAHGYVTTIFNNDEVLWLITPNATTADQILAEMPEFED
jgi:hypothetical protein